MAGVREALLDTSVLVAHLRKWIDLAQHANQKTNWYVSAISLGELMEGVRTSAQSKSNDTKLRLMVSDMGIFSVTEETAERYAQIASDLKARGSIIPQNDIWIAACALEHDLPVATRDPHFQRVKGLQVLMW